MKKSNINIVFIGNVNAINSFTHKGTQILDRIKAEKKLDINSSYKLESKAHYITIVDVSGHRNFIKNMITGTTQADCAVLMLSSTKEVSNYEQIRLMSNLGIRHIIVANMQSQAKWEEVLPYINKFEKTNFITISPDNEELLETLDKVQEAKTPINKPLRILIKDVFRASGAGNMFVGRVESGTLNAGMKIQIVPGNIITDVRAVEDHYLMSPAAIPGDNYPFNIGKTPLKDIKRGMVAGNIDENPPHGVRDFIAQIVILNNSEKIVVGYTPIIDCHTVSVSCTFSEILFKIDRRSGKEIETNPKQP